MSELALKALTLDRQLLIDLLSIVAPSEHEEPVRKYILDWLKTLVGYKDLKVTLDSKKNIFITKGESDCYPCIVAHMDEFAGMLGDSRRIVDLGKILVGLDEQTGDHCGCPGDDRAGVCIALQLLRELPDCKVAFFVEEEIGARNGSGQVELSFFDDCAFVLQVDREGYSEIITHSNGGRICSEEFEIALNEIGAPYEYTSSEYGTFTDCGVLSKRGVGVSCINLSAGYFMSHTVSEKVIPDLVENVLNLSYEVCTTLTYQRWENEFEEHKRSKFQTPSTEW